MPKKVVKFLQKSSPSTRAAKVERKKVQRAKAEERRTMMTTKNPQRK